MEIRSTREEESARLELLGELDIGAAPTLDREVERVLDEGCSALVLDLAGTTFLDSAGLGALIRAARTVDARGGTMSVLSPPGSEARLLIEMSHTGPIVGLRDA